MAQENSLVSSWIVSRGNSWLENLAIVLGGALFISVLAQVAIPLPWTPVPITGQTFGVAVMGLLWGYKRGTVSVLTYLGLGAVGLPVFAGGHAGITWAPTLGYLMGMAVSAGVLGWLADRGFTQTFLKTWLCACLGSLIIFTLGLSVLSFFIPKSQLLVAGFLPFLPGDILKNLAAATAVTQIQTLKKKESY